MTKKNTHTQNKEVIGKKYDTTSYKKGRNQHC